MDNQQTITVCVTGAAGQIAYSLIPLILTGQVFKQNRVNLKLMDISQMENVLKGVEMEILDGAYPLLNSVTSGSDPKVMFQDTDVVVFLGGFPRKPGMERKDLLTINGKIFKEQGEALNEVAKPDVKIIVVANPANTNCLILSKYATKIPKANFTCLTRLDQNRAVAQISQKLSVPVTDVKNVIIWGNHSTTQFPCVDFAVAQGKNVVEQLDQEYVQKDFLDKVQKRGGEVLKARNNSSVFSAANAVKDHLRDWCYGSEGNIVSMGILTDQCYDLPEDLCFSLPVICKGNFQYEIVRDLKLNEFGKEKLKVTLNELLDEKSDAGL